MEKVFKKGDVIVITSQKEVLYGGVASELWVAKYDRDITLDEAIDIHYRNMVNDYPGMNITRRMVESTLKERNDKFFLNDRGEVQTYYNHEVADSFDMLYLSGKMKRSDVAKLKNKYLQEFNIEYTKFPGDESAHYRVYEDITEWLKQQGIDI